MMRFVLQFILFFSQADDTDKEPEAETESSPAAEKTTAKTCNSLESLYSGQSASSKYLHILYVLHNLNKVY